MRLSEKKIVYLGKLIVKKLQEHKDINFLVSPEILERKISKVILDNIKLEDEIDHEVKKILEQHQREIKEGKIDYHRFFRKVKEQLVKQKGVVI